MMIGSIEKIIKVITNKHIGYDAYQAIEEFALQHRDKECSEDILSALPQKQTTTDHSLLGEPFADLGSCYFSQDIPA